MKSKCLLWASHSRAPLGGTNRLGLHNASHRSLCCAPAEPCLSANLGPRRAQSRTNNTRRTWKRTSDSGGPDIWPNKYSLITRLSNLLVFYLTELRGGPVTITKMVDDLNRGGALIRTPRVRKGEDARTPRQVRRADVIKLFADLRSGYSAEKQKSSSPFHYDNSLDTIRLIPYEERLKEPEEPKKSKGRSVA